ncbi:MAG: PEGA domain-containing protein [Treponema sp.]|nr:PEGA domain-containing protein [Treponema sp.]
MKRFFFFVPLFLSLLLLPLSARADTYDEVEGTGLYINSVPEGAKVFIDGVERGQTPFSLGSPRSGEYSVRVSKEGYVERRFRVVIRTRSRIEVTVDLEKARGELLLDIKKDPLAPASLAFDPAVYVDGTRVYDTILSLETGWRSVSVEAFGWAKRVETVYISEGSLHRLELVLAVSGFSVSEITQRRRRFNPDNSGALGSTELIFSVSAPGRGLLEVFDGAGALVSSQTLRPFITWSQNVSWNGKNSQGIKLPDGVYHLRLSVWQDETAPIVRDYSVELDASIEIRPLSAFSSVSGLFFSASPESLPKGSYQIEGAVLSGRPLLEGAAWKSLPLAITLRASPLDRLELAGSLGAGVRFGDSALLHGGASAKWSFFRPGESPAGFAAAFSYGWAENGPYTAFGMGTGAGLSFPVSLRIFQVPAVDLLFSPGLLWAGGAGYPESWVPRLAAGGGILFRYKSFSGGLSARWDYAPPSSDSSVEGPGPLMSALELKFFSSGLIFSLSGGIWHWKDNTGGFFGLGLGTLY